MPIHDDHYYRKLPEGVEEQKPHTFICSICHTITPLVSHVTFNAQIRRHMSEHGLFASKASTVVILFDKTDITEPYLADFMNWRVNFIGDSIASQGFKQDT